MSREAPGVYFKQVDGHLLVEPGSAPARETESTYRDLAVYCIERQIRRVLVKPGDDDPVGEHALRIALTTMTLAGLPAEFRIALLADTDAIAARYGKTERDLCAAGIDARMFDDKDGALRWLGQRAL